LWQIETLKENCTRHTSKPSGQSEDGLSSNSDDAEDIANAAGFRRCDDEEYFFY
jgi:hypothetical protein